jgi:hypothetical protein
VVVLVDDIIMAFNDPFNYSPTDDEPQSWRSALLYIIGVLLMVIVGFIGNGVL